MITLTHKLHIKLYQSAKVVKKSFRCKRSACVQKHNFSVDPPKQCSSTRETKRSINSYVHITNKNPELLPLHVYMRHARYFIWSVNKEKKRKYRLNSNSTEISPMIITGRIVTRNYYKFKKLMLNLSSELLQQLQLDRSTSVYAFNLIILVYTVCSYRR